MANLTGTFLPDVIFGTNGDDTIRGGGGLDVLSGLDGADWIDGEGGDDILNGGEGNDILISGAGVATVLTFLNGNEGDDVLYAASGGIAENFDGGDGIDTVSFFYRDRAVDVRLGVESIPLLDTIRNVEHVFGTRFDDSIRGDSNDNALSGGAGADNLSGGEGNDLLVGGIGADRMDGGTGIDTASYRDELGAVFVNLTLGRGYGNAAEGDTMTSVENATGTAYNDVLIGSQGDNVLDGGAGSDLLIGALGADHLVGGLGNDTVSYEDNQGGVFANLATRSGFNNSAQGDTYDNVENLVGGIYADFLIGDDGINRLEGGDGNDVLIGGLGPDILVGGNGIDTASYEDNQGAVQVSLATGRGTGNAAEGDQLFGIENLTGSAFADVLTGDANANRLDGGLGADRLTGGAGADTFVIYSADGAVDTITDFETGIDRIEMSGSATGMAAGALASSAFHTGSAAHDADDRVIFDAANGNLWFDSDGTGAVAAVLIAQVQVGVTLSLGDFVIG